MIDYIIAFHTHSNAIHFERTCKSQGITCTLMPIPRKISSNCGIGAKIKFNGHISSLISESIESIHEIVEKNNYKKIYQADE